ESAALVLVPSPPLAPLGLPPQRPLPQPIEPLLLRLRIRLPRLGQLAIEHRPIEVAPIIEIVHHPGRGLNEVKADVELALEPPQVELVDPRARAQRPGELTRESRFVSARGEIAQRALRLCDVAPLPPEIVVRQIRGKKLSRRIAVP